MPIPEFDFIVVGTGAGGGHAAARLVNAGFTVLNLEAGGDFWDGPGNGTDNEEKAYVTQIAANDELLWDWVFKCAAEVTGYEGTWAGLITIHSGGGGGATYLINGIALTPGVGPNTYDDTGTPVQVATSIWAAINNPANGFQVAGVKARTSQNFVIIDRVVPVVGPTTLSSDNPAKGTAVVSATGPVTQAQATVREVDQTMGRMVGGSGNHFGYLCYRAALEDYDEWDYAITKNTTAAADGIGVLTGTMTFAGNVVSGTGTLFTAELKVGDYIQDMAVPYPVGGSVPHRVASILSNTQLTLDPDPTGKPFPTGVNSFGLKNTIWNRSRMLPIYKAVENDIYYGPGGVAPNPVLHGANPFPAAELGYVGYDGIGDNGPWNTAPPATARVPVALDAMVRNLVGSVAPVNVPPRVPPIPDPPQFHFTLDRNGENNWGDPAAYPLPDPTLTAITGVDPYSAHKIPMNEIGFDSMGNEIAGGRQTGGLFHLNKYSERRSQLVVAIDPIRGNPNYTLQANCVVSRVLTEDSGSGLTAVGVEYYQRAPEGGEWSLHTAYGKDIVLSAGPIGTPAILLRSGIGAADRLAPHGIQQILDLPGVGADIINHQSAGAGSGLSFTLPTENNILLQGAYYAGLYKSSYTMSASRAASFSVGGHVVPPLPAVLFDQGPECRFNFGAGVGNEASPIGSNNYGLPTKQGTKNYGRAVNVGSNMFKNRSRGDGVRLRSTWPFDPPEFRDGRLENPDSFEVESFVELSTVLNARAGDPAVPGGLQLTYPTGSFTRPTVVQPTSIDQWAARVATLHSTVTSSLHAVSTVKMGPPSELASGFRSCLDSFGRLYGVKNLAVCDNSIYPTQTRGNPWLPTVAAAENLTAVWIQNGGLSF